MDKTPIEPTASVIAIRQRTKVARQAKRKALLEADRREPADWRGQHAAGIETLETARAGIRIRRVQAPLDWYWSRKLIDSREYDAGTSLRQAYELGVCGARDADQAGGGGGVGGYSEAQLCAAETYRKAIAAVGRHLAKVLVDVICCEYSADQIAKRTGEDRKGIMALLRVALRTLADHWQVNSRSVQKSG